MNSEIEDIRTAAFRGRLKAKIEEKNWSQNRTDKEAGLSQSYIRKTLSSGTRPKADALEKLANVLNVSTKWLLPDYEDLDVVEIEALRTEVRSIKAARAERKKINAYKNVAKPKVRSGVQLIPELDLRLSAGGGFHVGEENTKRTWKFEQSYLREQRLTGADIIVCEINGDSMEPLLSSGDHVMVNQDDKTVTVGGGVFAIYDSDALVVKRLERIPGREPAMLRLISDNPNHSRYDVLAEDTRIIGRVVWFARRL